MQGGGSKQGEGGVMMVVVVPAEEASGPQTSMFRGTKVLGEGRMIFGCFELSLRERIVIRDMRAGMRFEDTQVEHESRDGLGGHGATVVGMNRELVRQDVLPGAGVGDELFGEISRLALGDEPADDEATEDIEEDIQVVADPLGWAG